MDELSKLVAQGGGESLSMSTPDPKTRRPAPTESEPQPAQETTKERTLDRWFRERHGTPPLRKLKKPNEALILNAGPLKFSGNITLIEEDGTVTHHNELTLCRCGASTHKPHCDDQHLDVDFFHNAAINGASECSVVHRPQRLTLKCVTDGPLLFRGYLRMHNRKGQEYTSLNGALCRCGRSAKKPFCDCYPKR